MKPLLAGIMIAGALALFGVASCESTSKTSTAQTAEEPKWNGEVKDSDPCQPVRKKREGGAIVICKGTCPNKTSKCGRLESRRKGSRQDWKTPEGEPAVYDSSLEYRCVCVRQG